jgi:formylglycine-generating enzyme required for sulfatase activity
MLTRPLALLSCVASLAGGCALVGDFDFDGSPAPAAGGTGADASAGGAGGGAAGAAGHDAGPGGTAGAAGVAAGGAAGTAGADAGDGGDAGPVVTGSCDGLASTCGPSATDDCCRRQPVGAGTCYFGRGADECPGSWGANGCTAEDELFEVAVPLGAFSIDAFEVTVGRFKNFIAMLDGSEWAPKPGEGAYPAAGPSDPDAGIINGWDPSWNARLPRGYPGSLVSAACTAEQGTWNTDSTRPINCVSWFAAYAFCIWEGGRLPSEVEWEYAAGDTHDYIFPWGNEPAPPVLAEGPVPQLHPFCDSTAQPKPCGADALFSVGLLLPGSSQDVGAFDQAGNVSEWVLDWYSKDWHQHPDADNFPNLTQADSPGRVIKGGDVLSNSAVYVRAVARAAREPTAAHYTTGFRCVYPN